MAYREISVDELRYGMYVAKLDRPWTDTPFMFQGFVLQNEKQLETLKRFCKKVFVDPEKVDRSVGPPVSGVVHHFSSTLRPRPRPADSALHIGERPVSGDCERRSRATARATHFSALDLVHDFSSLGGRTADGATGAT